MDVLTLARRARNATLAKWGSRARHGTMRCWVVAVAACVVLLAGQYGHADGQRALLPGFLKKKEALARLPLDALSPQDRDRIRVVVEQQGLFRSMPSQVVPCDHGLYRFLLTYPETLVNIWKVLDISKVTLIRTGDCTFDASDGEGTRCRIEVVYRDERSVLIYAEGCYEGPLYPRPLTGKCVVHLRSRYGTMPDHSPVVGCDLDAFVDIDNIGLEILAKTIHPFVGRVADHNFIETFTFVRSLSRTCELKPYETQKLAGMLTDVDPIVQAAFSRLALQVADRAQGRKESTTSAHLASIESDAPPQ